MSPSSYEVVAVREAMQEAGLILVPDEERDVAMRIVDALHQRDLRLTSGGRTPSVDD